MSDKTCKTCKMWQERRLSDSGMCHRFPCVAIREPDDWCGEWAESKVIDEHTICNGFGVPMFKVTERENGTSVTEPIPDETNDELDWLKDENEKLKTDNAMYRTKFADSFIRLINEREKLREFVWDMWDYAVNREIELCNACSCSDGDFADCSACDEYDGACGIAKKRFEELYTDRMHELGIEVDKLDRQKDNTGD